MTEVEAALPDRLESELQSWVEDVRPLVDRLETAERGLAALKGEEYTAPEERHRALIDSLRAEHKEDTDVLVAAHGALIDGLRAEHKREADDLRGGLETAEDMIRRLNERINELESDRSVRAVAVAENSTMLPDPPEGTEWVLGGWMGGTPQRPFPDLRIKDDGVKPGPWTPPESPNGTADPLAEPDAPEPPAVPDEPAEPPTAVESNGRKSPVVVTMEQVRDYVIGELKGQQFSSSTIAARFDISGSTARRFLGELFELKIVRRPKGSPDTGRHARWEYNDDVPPGPRERPRSEPRVGSDIPVPRGTPVAHTGRPVGAASTPGALKKQQDAGKLVRNKNGRATRGRRVGGVKRK